MNSEGRDPSVSEPTDFSALKEQERENRKNLIINAAERVFTNKPFDQVTMRNIAKEAGITPTAIYRYFTDKQSLYAEAYVRSNNRLLKKLTEIIDSSSALCFEEMAMKVIDHFVTEEQNLKMRAHFMIDDSLSDELSIKLSENTRFFTDRIEEHLKRFTDDPDTRLLALTFFASLNGVLLTYRKIPGKTDEEITKNMKKSGAVIAQIFKDRILTGK